MSLQQAVQTIGTTQRLYFATPVAGADDPSERVAHHRPAGSLRPPQFGNPRYPTGYHWKIDNDLDATDVNSATVGTDATPAHITVDINFNQAGAQRVGEDHQRRLRSPPNHPTSPTSQIAIFLDNDVLTAPVVTGGGQSNQTEITGNFTSDSATQLASLISAGALPAEITTVRARR